MLTQRDFLCQRRRSSGSLLTLGALAQIASLPMRRSRALSILEDGTEVRAYYDETLELSAIGVSGPSSVEVTIASHSDPGTVFTVSGANVETALPADSSRLRVRRVSQQSPRWHDVAIQIRPL